jgi:hypothetical protein
MNYVKPEIVILGDTTCVIEAKKCSRIDPPNLPALVGDSELDN